MPYHCDPTPPFYTEDESGNDVWDQTAEDRWDESCEPCDDPHCYDCNNGNACDDPHCGECGNYCDGCSDCDPDNYYGSSRYLCRDVWPVTIHSYGHKPNPVFWSVGGFNATRLQGRYGKRHAFLGCEIEVEVSHDRINRDTAYNDLYRAFTSYPDIADRIYCKSDGSLEDGVELVSHPMTLGAWSELHQEGELNFYRDLYRAGMGSMQSCGMHIHLNKSAFRSPSHLARFAHLILGNPIPMQALAGRVENCYASFQKFQVCQTIKSGTYGNRGAVNLGNDQTVEVRMFASTLRPRRIMANLELCHSMMEYTRHRIMDQKTGKPIHDHLAFASFAEWVKANRSTYPNLGNDSLFATTGEDV